MALSDAPGLGADAGMASLLATIHGIYPQARVTSGYRGPTNPLTLRNPSSMHAMGSPSDPRAVDVAPIPGVSFNDYVSSVRKAGAPVAQAFDEASHPFPWTTGPNWHLASASTSPPPTQPYYNPQPQPGGQPPMPPRTPPMSLGAMMGQQAPVNMGGPPPVNTDVMGTSSLVPQGNSLGAMAQGMPQMPTRAPSKFTAGNILGTLGDALSAYGGKAPTFGPFLREQAMMDKQQGFEREKFNQELQMRMYAMMHPEEMLKAEAFSTAPQSVRQSMVDYENTMHPNVVGVQQQNGAIVNQVQPRQLNYQVGDIHPGTDGNYRFMGGDATNKASWEKVQ